MKQIFEGWDKVAARLMAYADNPSQRLKTRNFTLNSGQCASLRAISQRIVNNGGLIADEVGMGKTCIAVELVASVVEAGGRVAIVVPPGLGYQWKDELRGGDVDAPLILRSLWQYLSAWSSEQTKKQEAWFSESVVVISHAFINWRLGEHSTAWRWALLPELYARWRKRHFDRFPRGYRGNDNLTDKWINNAADSICNAIPNAKHHPAWVIMNELSENTPWPNAANGEEYGRSDELRPYLERAVGLGLGVFDLVIIDEAHKGRGDESGLSRLLGNVILTSNVARRFAMTATPVELDASQWLQTLGRIGLNGSLESLKESVADYEKAVKKIRQCPNNPEAFDRYKQSAVEFQKTLSPYLLRRDKREDQAVQKFAEVSELPLHAYRKETEIAVETEKLSTEWKEVVCAAEALSIVSSQKEESEAKRLRLTIGNGHGIAALIDDIHNDDEKEENQAESDQLQADKTAGVDTANTSDKRLSRVRWWQAVTAQAFRKGADSLFDHPAILSAVESIEKITLKNEKVLVFGRYTAPLRALVNLLNAREMLRCLMNNQPWPQSKISDDSSNSPGAGEWRAVEVAHRQLDCDIPLNEIQERLKTQYEQLEQQRKAFRRNLVSIIEKGFEPQATMQNQPSKRIRNLFEAFKNQALGQDPENDSLVLVGKALYEIMANKTTVFLLADFVNAFTELMGALSDRDEGDTDGNGELDEKEAANLWPELRERLSQEYNRQRGRFARLMYGGTKPETRRMLQLAFNRSNSYPQVLVAQSMVGREGLNLHKACRVVVLLHPEWNPGVVEQQIGRVDRVGSHWSKELDKAINNGDCATLPCIEVQAVIFKGTYDEHNWKVLKERWESLRAQLHGVVIPPDFSKNREIDDELIKEINGAAPNFSPAVIEQAKDSIIRKAS